MVIRLTIAPHDDPHASEVALDNYEGFDAIIDNEDMGVDEQSKELLNILMGWGWLESI